MTFKNPDKTTNHLYQVKQRKKKKKKKIVAVRNKRGKIGNKFNKHSTQKEIVIYFIPSTYIDGK
jgi:hypothetical protein